MPPQEDIAGIVEHARKAVERGDWEQAWQCWNTVLTQFPNHAPAYVGAGHALRQARRYDEAERVLAAGARLFPEDEKIVLAGAWLANTRHDWSTAVDRWEAACARFPENPWCYVGKVHALQGLGRTDQVEAPLAQAQSALVAAKQRGLDARAALRVEFAIARARLDWPSVRECAEKIIAGEPKPAAQTFLGMAQASWHLGAQDDADRAARRALASDPTLGEAVLIRAWVATERGDEETALSCYSTLVDLNPGTVRWSLKLVQLLTWVGRVNEAVSELEKIRNRWPNDPMVRMFARNYGPALAGVPGSAEAGNRPTEGDPDRAEWDELESIANRAPDSAQQLRPLVDADPECDVLLAEVQGADTAVLIFTGGNDAVSMPLPIFDRYLAALPITALYLKDFRRLRYLLGVQSLSKDYPGTIAALQAVLKRLQIKRLCTIGNCEGGFAAIRYGVELGADRIVTFGAPTFSPDDDLAKIEQARNFMRNRLAEKVPRDMIDLKPFLESSRHRAQIEFFYEDEDPRDRIHASNISGLPGVHLHPQPGLNHGMLRRLALSEQDFRGMLAKLLDVEPGLTSE